MSRKYITIFFLCFIMLMISTGCGKTFWEYDCIWYSESPYVYLETRGHDSTIEIDGEKMTVDTAWENDGTGITFSDKSIDNGTTDASIIWETKVEIKSGKMYLTIIEDYVSDMEGEVIILEQKEYEE